MADFTPGPWQVVEHEIWDTGINGEPGIPLFRRDNNYRRWGRDLRAGQAEANARLIAAAPDLLEALQEAVDLADATLPMFSGRTDECEASYQKAVAAIAKALGQ